MILVILIRSAGLLEFNEKGYKYEIASQEMSSWGLSMSPSLSKIGYVVVYVFVAISNFSNHFNLNFPLCSIG